MGQSRVLPDTTVQIRRTFLAPRERVFTAWTDPEGLKKWFGHDDTCVIPFAEVDLRVGGRYRIRIETEKGGAHQVTGVYREVKAPEKLVFTWLWEEGGMDIEETLVTIEFQDIGELSTEVILTHERFPDETAVNNHRQGWQGSLDRLSRATSEDLTRQLDPKQFPIPVEEPTLATLLALNMYHEGYHSGQLALGRRLLGKPSGLGV